MRIYYFRTPNSVVRLATADNFYVLYTFLVRPKLEYACFLEQPLHLLIRAIANEFQENLPPRAIADLCWHILQKL